ncbi:c-type cytochrome [Helicobacter sp. T3_23-1056]
MKCISFDKTLKKLASKMPKNIATFGALCAIFGVWQMTNATSNAQTNTPPNVKPNAEYIPQSVLESSTKESSTLDLMIDTQPQKAQDAINQSNEANDKSTQESSKEVIRESNKEATKKTAKESKPAQPQKDTKSTQKSTNDSKQSIQSESKSNIDFGKENHSLANEHRNDESFITPQEYGASLYEYPRGIGCIKCHGNIGEETLLATYKHKGKQKTLLVPRINNLELSHFRIALSQDNGIMPKYNLTDEEIQAIFLYISSKNPTRIK